MTNKDKPTALRAWNVFDKGHLLDTVFFQPSMTETEVLESLIDRDNFPTWIRIYGEEPTND